MPHPFLNFHTHRPAVSSAETVIRNYIFPLEQPEETKDCEHLFSIGIHPWHIPHNIDMTWTELCRQANRPNCIAVGETGIDQNANSPIDIQSDIFLRHAELAATYHLPLIIHCVKAWNELINLKKSLPQDLPCIIHGFRGKPQLAESLLSQDFYLSFGVRFNPESLLLCPSDKLFLETDENPLPVEEVYRTAAALRACSPENLRIQCLDNLTRLTQRAKK